MKVTTRPNKSHFFKKSNRLSTCFRLETKTADKTIPTIHMLTETICKLLLEVGKAFISIKILKNQRIGAATSKITGRLFSACQSFPFFKRRAVSLSSTKSVYIEFYLKIFQYYQMAKITLNKNELTRQNNKQFYAVYLLFLLYYVHDSAEACDPARVDGADDYPDGNNFGYYAVFLITFFINN